MKDVLGEPLTIRQLSKLVGLSPWSIRQRLVPKGLPHFRTGASGKFVFYREQVVAWIEKQQQKGGKQL